MCISTEWHEHFPSLTGHTWVPSSKPARYYHLKPDLGRSWNMVLGWCSFNMAVTALQHRFLLQIIWYDFSSNQTLPDTKWRSDQKKNLLLIGISFCVSCLWLALLLFTFGRWRESLLAFVILVRQYPCQAAFRVSDRGLLNSLPLLQEMGTNRRWQLPKLPGNQLLKCHQQSCSKFNTKTSWWYCDTKNQSRLNVNLCLKVGKHVTKSISYKV